MPEELNILDTFYVANLKPYKGEEPLQSDTTNTRLSSLQERGDVAVIVDNLSSDVDLVFRTLHWLSWTNMIMATQIGNWLMGPLISQAQPSWTQCGPDHSPNPSQRPSPPNQPNPPMALQTPSIPNAMHWKALKITE